MLLFLHRSVWDGVDLGRVYFTVVSSETWNRLTNHNARREAVAFFAGYVRLIRGLKLHHITAPSWGTTPVSQPWEVLPSQWRFLVSQSLQQNSATRSSRAGVHWGGVAEHSKVPFSFDARSKASTSKSGGHGWLGIPYKGEKVRTYLLYSNHGWFSDHQSIHRGSHCAGWPKRMYHRLAMAHMGIDYTYLYVIFPIFTILRFDGQKIAPTLLWIKGYQGFDNTHWITDIDSLCPKWNSNPAKLRS